jgi:hypothetical protein
LRYARTSSGGSTRRNTLEETKFTSFFCHRGCASKGEAHPSGAQVIGSFSELTQQALASFRGQAIRYPNQVGIFSLGNTQDFLDADGWTQENRPPACRFSQAQKVQHPCDMNTFPQGCCYDRLLHLPSKEMSGWSSQPLNCAIRETCALLTGSNPLCFLIRNPTSHGQPAVHPFDIDSGTSSGSEIRKSSSGGSNYMLITPRSV